MEGEVAEATGEIIRETCKERDIEIIANILEGRIKNRKKAKSLYNPVIKGQFKSSAVVLKYRPCT